MKKFEDCELVDSFTITLSYSGLVPSTTSANTQQFTLPILNRKDISYLKITSQYWNEINSANPQYTGPLIIKSNMVANSDHVFAVLVFAGLTQNDNPAAYHSHCDKIFKASTPLQGSFVFDSFGTGSTDAIDTTVATFMISAYA